MLPPGRARLATRPMLTGSYTATNTIGMVAVAAFRASLRSGDERPPKIRSTKGCRHRRGWQRQSPPVTAAGCGAVAGTECNNAQILRLVPVSDENCQFANVLCNLPWRAPVPNRGSLRLGSAPASLAHARAQPCRAMVRFRTDFYVQSISIAL